MQDDHTREREDFNAIIQAVKRHKQPEQTGPELKDNYTHTLLKSILLVFNTTGELSKELIEQLVEHIVIRARLDKTGEEAKKIAEEVKKQQKYLQEVKKIWHNI